MCLLPKRLVTLVKVFALIKYSTSISISLVLIYIPVYWRIYVHMFLGYSMPDHQTEIRCETFPILTNRFVQRNLFATELVKSFDYFIRTLRFRRPKFWPNGYPWENQLEHFLNFFSEWSAGFRDETFRRMKCNLYRRKNSIEKLLKSQSVEGNN